MDALAGVIRNKDMLVSDNDFHRCVEYVRTGAKVDINVVYQALFFVSHTVTHAPCFLR